MNTRQAITAQVRLTNSKVSTTDSVPVEVAPDDGQPRWHAVPLLASGCVLKGDDMVDGRRRSCKAATGNQLIYVRAADQVALTGMHRF
jgi:hypothetical protein